MLWPTASAARFLPRRFLSRRYCSPKEVRERRTPCAAWTSAARRYRFPFLDRPLSRFPALSDLAWTDPRPGAQVRRIRKTFEVCSDLCHQDGENLSAHPIDGFAALHLFLKRAEMSFNLCLQTGNRAILNLDELKQLPQKKARVLSHFCC